MVATADKLEANRANAKLSTGPRTADGKRASRLNALTTGAYAAEAVLPGEDPAAYDAFRREQLAGLRPLTAPQRFLADRAASLMWRLQRLQQAQHTLDLSPESFVAAYADDSDNAFDRLTKAEQRLTGMLNTTLRNLRQLRSGRPNSADPGPATEKLQNEPKPIPSSPSSAPSAPPRCNASPKELQNEPNLTSSFPTSVPSVSSVFSPPPGKLRNEPKPKAAQALFRAAARAADDLITPCRISAYRAAGASVSSGAAGDCV